MSGDRPPVFDGLSRKRCDNLYGIDPDESYGDLMLEVKVGGPAYQRICTAILHHEHRVSFRGSERRVLTLLAIGLNGHQAAQVLCISPETVKSHVKQAKRRSGARTTTAAVALLVASDAIDLGFLDIERAA